ncbi:hypothetical protein KR038_002350 [Drosophila bunnanda]|nr:hypothetical protein KR038_002350 [Drosophila bunnanda]
MNLKVTIKNCLSCDHVEVNFSRSDNVHVIVYNAVKGLSKDVPAVTPVAQAILLLCTLTYPDGDSLANLPSLVLGQGMVSLTFERLSLNSGGGAGQPQEPAVVDDPESDLDMDPCTSQQAMERLRQRQERKAKREVAAKRAAGGGGGVPSTSKDIQVTVTRRFDIYTSMDSVFVQINGGETDEMTIKRFHKEFFTRSQHSFSFLKLLHDKCAGNWLQVIQSDNDAYSGINQPDSPFETFIKLFDRQTMEPQDTLCRLATKCLQVNETVRLTERRFVLNVFDQVRQIFEYITVQEYTVWFLVPSRKNSDEQPVVCIISEIVGLLIFLNILFLHKNLDDFDLTKVRTCIRAASDSGNIFWNYANHNIKDILMVSFQLALASHANQSVLVMSHMDMLSEFVTMQYVTASFMNDIYGKKPSSPKWYCHRYLQRIVDMALFMGTIVIIEYPSAFTLLKDGRKLIKCFPKQKEGDGGALEWEIFEGVVRDDESDIQVIKNSFKIN